MKAIKYSFLLTFLITAGICSLSAQWVQTNGPYGGHVVCFAVSGTNLFAGTVGAGIFLSTDNGTTWTKFNNFWLNNMPVISFAVSDTNLFAGTEWYGVYRSTDNGTSWTAVNNGLTNQYVGSFAVSGMNLFAGTYGGGVFLSTNNGTSWTAVDSGLTNMHVNSFTVLGTNIFAGTLTLPQKPDPGIMLGKGSEGG